MTRLISLVIPVFNEEDSLQELSVRIREFISSTGNNCEVLFVDDHSSDRSPEMLKQLCENNSEFRYIRLSKNSGSHVAILAGLEQCKGDCAIFMASDLQDPPELVAQMIEEWKEGNAVVWAVREQIEGISFFEKMFSRMYYYLLTKFGTVDLPPSGADFALVDRKVINGLSNSKGSVPSLGGLIVWLGFKQTEIKYVKEARKYGRSKWSLSKKIAALIDGFVSFSYFPLRFSSYVGIGLAIIGFIYAMVVIGLKVSLGTQITGWASLMVVVLVVGGIQLLMLGVIGEYLWRNIEESRKRPLYFIEEESNEGS